MIKIRKTLYETQYEIVLWGNKDSLNESTVYWLFISINSKKRHAHFILYCQESKMETRKTKPQPMTR